MGFVSFRGCFRKNGAPERVHYGVAGEMAPFEGPGSMHSSFVLLTFFALQLQDCWGLALTKKTTPSTLFDHLTILNLSLSNLCVHC